MVSPARFRLERRAAAAHETIAGPTLAPCARPTFGGRPHIDSGARAHDGARGRGAIRKPLPPHTHTTPPLSAGMAEEAAGDGITQAGLDEQIGGGHGPDMVADPIVDVAAVHPQHDKDHLGDGIMNCAEDTAVPQPTPDARREERSNMLHPPQSLGPGSQGFRSEFAAVLVESSPFAINAVLDFWRATHGDAQTQYRKIVLRVQVGALDANSGGTRRTPEIELSCRDPQFLFGDNTANFG